MQSAFGIFVTYCCCVVTFFVFFFKQKTAYEMRISDWSSDVCSSDLEGDKKIDQIEVDVERLAVRLIALRAPMADDLREVVAALKTAGVIERIGDYAKNIAKRVAIFAESNPIAPMTIVPEMARVVAQMVKSALDAFVARHADLAARGRDRGQKVEDFYNSLFRTLLTYMMENPNNITDRKSVV